MFATCLNILRRLRAHGDGTLPPKLLEDLEADLALWFTPTTARTGVAMENRRTRLIAAIARLEDTWDRA